MTSSILSRMASRFVVGIEGTGLSDTERAILSAYPPAGVILFSRNVSSLRQTQGLTAEVSRIVEESSGLPPLIMADHEGGRISVLARAIGVPPAQMAIARAGDHSLGDKAFSETAHRLSLCGVNTILGPVADINTEPLNPVIGTRSFGEDRVEVSQWVHCAITAFAAGGSITCIKHFPGHGGTGTDSHHTLPVLGTTIGRLERREILPFTEGIEAGADMVMVGHLAMAERMPPASLDPNIVLRLLRERMAFHGVVITDALEMEGAHRAVPGGDVPARTEPMDRRGGDATIDLLRYAFGAGNDLLLFSRSVGLLFAELEDAGRAADGLWGGRGEPPGLGDGESYRRIEALRARIAGDRVGDIPGDSGGRFDDTPYRRIAEKSVQVIRDPSAALPVGGDGGFRLTFLGEREDFENDVVRRFIGCLHSILAGTGEKGNVSADHLDELVSQERLHPGPVFEVPGSGEESRLFEFTPLSGGPGSPAVLVLVGRRPVPYDILHKCCSQTSVAVIAGWPYAAELLPGELTVICTFGLYDAAAGITGSMIMGL
ncbi:MAG: glycoside hydrolase family 3 protein [bacterium]|nr:MAG: glycoside hydrolase family 3 protein [bacterium]